MPMPPHPAPAESGPWHRLASVVTCPVCGGSVTLAGSALCCSAGHAFDRARQGYVSLLTGAMRVPSADTASMVTARADVLAAGHFAPLATALARHVARLAPAGHGSVVLDAGAGTGYYLGHVLDALPGAHGLGLDASKFAARRAARAHPRLGAAVWDVWRPLPVRGGAVDVLTNVFAPRNAPEFHRVLAPHGALLVVTPTPRHLAQLRAALPLLSVDDAKERRLRDALARHFEPATREVHEYDRDLDAPDLARLVAMGPSAHHVGDPAALTARLGRGLRVTLSFRISVHRPLRPGPSASG
ncbi:putative RNA methyltransferase [Streptomyces sp. B6B3]|uniref:putative RNA methyltransferase n=1 Tax=Streptomyces sp. B6B3 TaxID=3153570 RepID=UPI00325F52F6